MRAIVTGQVGVDKGPYLEAVAATAKAAGHDLVVCHVGRMMYAEAPDVPPGRILNLPITRLNTLRRAVFKEILRTAERHEHIIVNTHATFRWRHGLFSAFDFDQIKAFNADIVPHAAGQRRERSPAAGEGTRHRPLPQGHHGVA